jgi:hypothetical protein
VEGEVQRYTGAIEVRRRLSRLIALTLIALALPAPGLAMQAAPDDSRSNLSARIDRPIRNLAIAPEELGPHWRVIPESVQEIDDEYPAREKDPLALFQARYRNEVDFQPGRETAVLVAEFQDHGQAEIAMREYLNYVILSGQMPDARWSWDAEEVRTGDGGVRFGYRYRDNVMAGYLFTTDTYLGGVLVRGSAADEEVLLSQAVTLASRQEALLEAPAASR